MKCVFIYSAVCGHCGQCGVCGLCGGSGHGGCGVRPLRKLTVHFWFCFRSFCGSVSPFKRAAQYAPELGGARASSASAQRRLRGGMGAAGI